MGVAHHRVRPVDLAAVQEQMPDAVYSTKNFNLNYLSAGKAGAPPTDADYLRHATYKGKKHAGHPRFVTDLGDFLEDARSWLPDVKMQVSEVWFDRYEVFVIPVPDFGESKLGGPMIITSDLSVYGAPPPTLSYDMRRTCVHELIHVAQDDTLSNLQDFTLGLRWWIESTAEHLSLKLMRTRAGQPNPSPHFYTSRCPTLPATGMDGSTTLQPYAYAKLFDLMADRGVDTADLIKAVSARWNINEKALDEEIRSRTQGPGLFDYHAAFAGDYFYDNAWTGNMTGAGALNAVYATSTRDMFSRITTRSRGSLVARFYGETLIKEPAVVSKIYPFSAAALPEERETRLVVQVEAPPGAKNISVFFAEQRGNLPLADKPGPPTTLYPLPVATRMSTRRMASPLKKDTDINRVVVTVNHGSFATGDAPIIVRRWLLMAPSWVRSYRQTDGTYEVTWHPAEIKSSGDGSAFKGYHVYRRKVGATEFPMKPVNQVPMTDEFYIDTPPSRASGSTPFGSRTRPATSASRRPSTPVPTRSSASGRASSSSSTGRFRLATRLARSEIEKMGAGNEAGVEGFISTIHGMTMGIDALLQFGIPVTAEVQPHRGKYKLTIVSVLWMPVEEEEEDELILDRLGQSTIGMLPKTPRGNALLLSVNKPDRVHHKYFDTIENDPDVGTMRFGLEIDFKRKDPKPPKR